MRMTFKKLKKLISVTIICTMIATLFVPTLSVQAAEAQAIQNVVENYTDIENSAYKINSVSISGASYEVSYSAPTDCKVVVAEYDGITDFLVSTDVYELCEAENGTSEFYFSRRSSQSVKFDLFIVDENYRPLGKAYSSSAEITGICESSSVSTEYFYLEPHPTVPLKNDSGHFPSGSEWSVDTNGLLSIPEGNTFSYVTGKNIAPWNEYREGITSIYIDPENISLCPYLFDGLSKVKEVTIPADIELEDNTFIDMASLETVTIEPYTDYYCYYNITGASFMNCPSLKEFVVDDSDCGFCSVDGVLYSKDKTRLIKYPAGKTDKTFTIPDTVTSIDEYAFEGAVYLESIYNVSDISNGHIFINCTSLKNIEITSHSDTFYTSAFYNCKSLTEITLPDSIKYANDCWRYSLEESCGGLETTSLESINIPLNIKYADLFSAKLPGTLKNVEISAKDTNYKLVDGVLYSPDMKVLYRYLGGNENTTFTVPESVTKIDYKAFKDCKNLEYIEIGSNVTKIYSSAFEGCSALKSISIPNTSVIEDSMFKNCTNLKNVDLGIATRIYSAAFYGCNSLETITIPATVKSIGSGVFAYCDSLKSINVAEGNTSYSTIDGCLYEYNTLKEFPNAKSKNYVVSDCTAEIGENAFMGRTSLESVVIPDSVGSIGEYAFAECPNLVSVTLSEIIYELPCGVFNKCTSLSSINIPLYLWGVERLAFGDCKSLKTIDFTEKAEPGIHISTGAFSHCGLESIVIPEGSNVEYSAFLGCYDMKTIKFLGDSYFSFTSFMFWNIDDLTIYYPQGNPSWDSTKLYNYQHKDSLKFVPFDNGYPDSDASYTFTGLEPDTPYIVGISNGPVSVDIFVDYYYGSSQIMGVDLLESDSNGNITLNYKKSNYVYKIVPFALGTPKYDISEASIYIPEVVFTGKYYFSNPDNYTVTLDGKELVEGVDYLVAENTEYNYADRECCFSIVGIGNYYGSSYTYYYVYCSKYDVDGDGIVSIKDTTAIQLYLAGFRDLYNPEAADANGDGEIGINDATHIQKLIASVC